MPDFIPTALFRPPAFPFPYVPREGLHARFKNARSAKVILIEAAGGYGKSIGVAEFVHDLPAPSVWYPLEHLPRRTLTGFLWNLVKAIQTIWPEFGGRSSQLLETLLSIDALLQNDAWLYVGLLPGLAAEFNGLQQSIWIVLDNYHLLHNERDFDRVLTFLVEHTRSHIHFVILSRERMTWPQRAQWQSQKSLIVMDAGMLAFSQKESLTLANKLGLFLPPDLFKRVVTRMNGQPFLHNLLVRSCLGKSASQIHEILSVLADPAQHATDYLAKAYMQSETQAVRTFLWRTSLLKVLDPPTCDTLLEIQESQSILQRLSGDVFIEPVGSSPGQSSFIHGHEIIREFLQRALLEEFGLGEVQRLYKRLGEIYLERDDVSQAIENFCLGRHFTEASRLVYDQARYLVNTVQLPRLSGWLKFFTKDWIQSDAVLLIYLGVIQSNEENPLARDTFLQARRLFAEHGDPEGMAWAMIELGWSEYMRCEYADARQALEAALAEPGISARLRARGLHYLAVTLHGSDDFAQALAYADEAIRLLRRLDTREDRAALARLFRHLGQIHESIGQIQQALSLNQEAHELGYALGLGDWAMAWIDYEWAENCLFSGRIEEGHAHLDEVDALLAPYRTLNISSPLLDSVLITRAELVQEGGDYERAAQIYSQVSDLPISFLALLKLVQPGCETEALELAQGAWRQLQNHNSPVFRAKAQTRLGVAWLGTHELTQARLHLEESAAALERCGAIHALMTARLYLAKLYQSLGETFTAAGQENLHYVFSQMAARGYYGLLIWQPDVAAEMCAEALRAGIEPDFVERLAIKRLNAAQAPYFTALANGVDEAVCSRAQRILSALGGPALSQARKKLSQCKNAAVGKRLEDWLVSGWLKDTGLLWLAQVLSWRQIEVFLLWISPDTYGRTERIASETFITVDTVNTHLKESRAILSEKMNIQFPKGKGAYMAAYDWAILNGIVDPRAPRSLPTLNHS